MNLGIKVSKILYPWTLLLDPLIFVEKNMYILLHACSDIVRLVHSWAVRRCALSPVVYEDSFF